MPRYKRNQDGTLRIVAEGDGGPNAGTSSSAGTGALLVLVILVMVLTILAGSGAVAGTTSGTAAGDEATAYGDDLYGRMDNPTAGGVNSEALRRKAEAQRRAEEEARRAEEEARRAEEEARKAEEEARKAEEEARKAEEEADAAIEGGFDAQVAEAISHREDDHGTDWATWDIAEVNGEWFGVETPAVDSEGEALFVVTTHVRCGDGAARPMGVRNVYKYEIRWDAKGEGAWAEYACYNGDESHAFMRIHLPGQDG